MWSRVLDVGIGFKKGVSTLFIDLESPNSPIQVAKSSLWTWVLIDDALIFVMMRQPLEIDSLTTLYELVRDGKVEARSLSLREKSNRSTIVEWFGEAVERGWFGVEIKVSSSSKKPIKTGETEETMKAREMDTVVQGIMELRGANKNKFCYIVEYVRGIDSSPDPVAMTS